MFTALVTESRAIAHRQQLNAAAEARRMTSRPRTARAARPAVTRRQWLRLTYLPAWR